MNQINLIGRLVRDPDLRYTAGGTAVSNFTLAVDRNYKNKEGERDVDFIEIAAWRKLGETCAKHLGKGRLVGVSGFLKIDKNESEKDGKTYINPKVVADQIKFLDWPEDNQTGGSNNSDDNFDNLDDVDIPF